MRVKLQAEGFYSFQEKLIVSKKELWVVDFTRILNPVHVHINF